MYRKKCVLNFGYTQRNWLENSIELTVYSSDSLRLGTLINKIFDEVSKKIKISNKTRTKEAINTILINLWIGKQMDIPINYSRNKNNYVSDKRYGKLFFKYNRIIPVIDALEDLGYIHQKKGVYNKEKKLGWQSRMWGTNKLCIYFIRHGLYEPTFFKKPKPKDLIILKDKKEDKTEIGYRETKQTKQWREDLNKYNNFIKKNKVDVRLNQKIEVSNRFFLRFLFTKIITTNKIELREVIINNITKYKKYPLLKILNKQIQPTMTNTFSSNRLLDKGLQHICGISFFKFWFLPQLQLELGKCKSKKEKKVFLSVKHVLGNLGFERIIFRLNYEYLHRVFNRKTFKKGGRAYGALHQNIPILRYE
jgi:hypothetical protein